MFMFKILLTMIALIWFQAGATENKEENMSSIYYFAYGSNMWSVQMEDRMHKAGPKRMVDEKIWEKEIQLEKIINLGRVILDNYKLSFAAKSRNHPGGGCGTISPMPDACVEGVLYELTDKHLEIMDLYENVNATNPLYYRTTVKVRDQQGKIYTAVVYIATEDDLDETRRPTENYLLRFLWGAGENKLSLKYIKELANTEVVSVITK